jgi:hypothetical protein
MLRVFPFQRDGTMLNLRRKYFFERSLKPGFQPIPFWELGWVWGIPPLPPTSETLDWRGFCKNGLQNLERLGVRCQNLDFKELTGFFKA